MTTRDELRGNGAALRARLFGPTASQQTLSQRDSGGTISGIGDLFDEVTFGAVWSRPGLALPDRMIATLAALCAVQRLTHLRRYVGAALDLDMQAEVIVEICVQCGIYAGFTASEEALAAAGAVFAERGVAPPSAAPGTASLDELNAHGRALLEELHGARGYEGYAAPDNPVTGALYPLAIQYGYGEIWHRPGLDRRQRALCAVAAFTALRLDGQVRKFGQSALNAGLGRTEIIEAVIQTGPYSGLAPALNALAALSDVLGE
ncbi:MAG: carboxymuconolactone decarboxylase family protein [Alphaproteobacteria bacterium]